MPRPPRPRLPGISQHVRQRGLDGQAIFFDDADRRFYLACLDETARWYGLAVHAYCLMTNHVHLLATPREADSVERSMQRLGGLYVQHINRRCGRSGTLWEGRYRACLVDDETYVLACYRYIESNPVRAGMVGAPAHYRWSSHRNSAVGEADALVTPHAAYVALGATGPERRRAYRELFDFEIGDEVLDAVRGALIHNHVLGSDRFRAEVEAMLGRRLGHGKPGRPRQAADRLAGAKSTARRASEARRNRQT